MQGAVQHMRARTGQGPFRRGERSCVERQCCANVSEKWSVMYRMPALYCMVVVLCVVVLYRPVHSEFAWEENKGRTIQGGFPLTRGTSPLKTKRRLGSSPRCSPMFTTRIGRRGEPAWSCPLPKLPDARLFAWAAGPC